MGHPSSPAESEKSQNAGHAIDELRRQQLVEALGAEAASGIRRLALPLHVDLWRGCRALLEAKNVYVAEGRAAEALAVERFAQDSIIDVVLCWREFSSGHAQSVPPPRAVPDDAEALLDVLLGSGNRTAALVMSALSDTGALLARDLRRAGRPLTPNGCTFTVPDGEEGVDQALTAALRTAFVLPEDGRPVDLIASPDVAAPDIRGPEARAREDSWAAEGEALALPLIFHALRQAFPDRTIRTRLGTDRELGVDAFWRSRHLVCLGAADSNAAVRQLMEHDAFKRPSRFVEHHVQDGVKRNSIPHPDSGEPLGDDRHPELPGAGRALDRAVHYIGAPNPWSEEARVYLAAGNTTHGTAFATALLTRTDYLMRLAASRTANTATCVTLEAEGGYHHLWPATAKVLGVESVKL